MLKFDDNPIAQHVRAMVESGAPLFRKCSHCGGKDEFGPASLEAVAYLIDMKYPTLCTSMIRPRVSYTTRMALLRGGIITHDIIRSYDKYLVEKGIDREARGKRKHRRRKKVIGNSAPEPTESPGRSEAVDPVPREPQLS